MLLSPCSVSTVTFRSSHMLCRCSYDIFITDHVTWGSQEFGLWVFCLAIAERDIPTCSISYIYIDTKLWPTYRTTPNSYRSMASELSHVFWTSGKLWLLHNGSGYAGDNLDCSNFFHTSPCFAFHRRILSMHEVWTVLYHSLECILSVNLDEDSAMTKHYTKFVSIHRSLHHFPNTNID